MSKVLGIRREENLSNGRNPESVCFELHSRKESLGRNRRPYKGSRGRKTDNNKQEPPQTITRNQQTNSYRNDNSQSIHRNTTSKVSPVINQGDPTTISISPKNASIAKALEFFTIDCGTPRLNVFNWNSLRQQDLQQTQPLKMANYRQLV